MSSRYRVFSEFVSVFLRHAFQIREVIIILILLILLCGFLISRIENINLGDGIYFAFITALSVGYGDISPSTVSGKVVSVFTGIIGMLTVGISVAIANRSLAEVVSKEARNG